MRSCTAPPAVDHRAYGSRAATRNACRICASARSREIRRFADIGRFAYGCEIDASREGETSELALSRSMPARNKLTCCVSYRSFNLFGRNDCCDYLISIVRKFPDMRHMSLYWRSSSRGRRTRLLKLAPIGHRFVNATTHVQRQMSMPFFRNRIHTEIHADPRWTWIKLILMPGQY